MKPRAALYCRISEKDKNYDKVETQEKNLKKLAAESGYEVVATFKDDGISAFATSGKLKARPAWDKLAVAVTNGDYDVVLAVAPDRLARNVGTADAFYGICAQHGVKVHTKTAGVVDPSDPQSKAMAGVMNIFAELDVAVRMAKQRDRIDDEISKGNALWGRRPYGYTSLRNGKQVPEEVKRIERAYEDILKREKSLNRIAREWNDEGVLTTAGNAWSYQTVRQLILRPRNAGLVQRGGEIVPNVTGNWEPIVSPEILEEVSLKLNEPDRRTTTNREHRWLCSGLAKCGACGAQLGSASTTLNGTRVAYYRCRAKNRPLAAGAGKIRHTAVRAEELDKAVRGGVVSAYLLGPKALLPTTEGEDLSGLHEERGELLNALEDLTTLESLKSFKPSQLHKRATEINSRLGEIAGIEADIRAKSAHAQMTADLIAGLSIGAKASFTEAAAASKALGERFDAMPLAMRKKLVDRLLDVTVHPGRKLGRVEIWHKVATSLNPDNEVLS